MVQATNSSQKNSSTQPQAASSSTKQRKLQQQYKQNIVQYNKLSIAKSNEKYINKQQQMVNVNNTKNQQPPKKNKNNNAKKPALTESKDTTVKSTKNKESNNVTFANEDTISKNTISAKNNERRGSSSTWNLDQKAAMPYGLNSVADDDYDDNVFLSQALTTSITENTPKQDNHQTQPQKPVYLTPLQQQSTLSMPLTPNSNGYNPMMMQNYKQQQLPPFGYQMQQQLGMPLMMQPPLQPPPPNINQQQFQQQYRLFLMEQQKRQMMNNSMPNMMGNPHTHMQHMMQSPPMNVGNISPKIETIALAQQQESSANFPASHSPPSSIRTAKTTSTTSKPAKGSSGKLKKQKDFGSSEVLNTSSSRKSQYAGTSFGLAAPVLESFPKPSF